MSRRRRLGRPDIAAHTGRFDVRPAAAHDVGVTFLGVSTLLVDDGRTAIMTDGFFTRPSLLRVGLGRIAPDDSRIDAALTRLRLYPRPAAGGLAAVIPVHTHFDHAMDSAVVARRTGAVLVGSESAANIGRGAGLPTDKINIVDPSRPVTYGDFTLTFVASAHCPPDRFPGTIAAPVVPPVKAAAYKCGEAWSVLVEHAGGRTALVQGSAGFVPGSLDGRRADVVYLGVGQLGVLDRDYITAYWRHTVEAVGARRVVLVHWDDFFRPLDRPLRALPYLGDNLDVTIDVLGRLAEAQGVALRMPTVWQREDPWA
ncbi:MBL fold metallo-hydrolase [Virgisporangium aurantiacum]|uniref:MBL fold metallo-hydrolase n=1 Tax=Virgisporangium aurantiacum TaxID=175570 RepID=A0A8J3ZEP5_9ACTN|nr:MBL fold metallo-hydrolase [Virgisporangium aurantiacum]GIJ62779.1 MBL fold metallo-hydrolase [Virgisporangium aurantiacum]